MPKSQINQTPAQKQDIQSTQGNGPVTHINNMWVTGPMDLRKLPEYDLTKAEINMGIDWITCSFRSRKILDHLEELKPLELADQIARDKEPEDNEFAEQGLTTSHRPLPFWEKTYEWFKGAKVAVGMKQANMSEDKKQRVMIVLSGKPLLHLRKRYGLNTVDIIKWFQKFMGPDSQGKPMGRFTRVDIAIDVLPKNSEFSLLHHCLYHIHSNAYTTTAKNNGRVKQIFERVIDENKLQTLYIGSRKSETFARIYDKRAEQIGTGHKDPGEEWNRFELETKQGRAEALMLKIMKDIDAGNPWNTVACGVVKKFINFRDLEEARKITRMKRCKTADWWNRILCKAEALSLPTIIPEPLPLSERIQNDIKQIAKRFFGLSVVYSEDKSELLKMLKKLFRRGQKAYDCDSYQFLIEYMEELSHDGFVDRERVQRNVFAA